MYHRPMASGVHLEPRVHLASRDPGVIVETRERREAKDLVAGMASLALLETLACPDPQALLGLLALVETLLPKWPEALMRSLEVVLKWELFKDQWDLWDQGDLQGLQAHLAHKVSRAPLESPASLDLLEGLAHEDPQAQLESPAMMARLASQESQANVGPQDRRVLVVSQEPLAFQALRDTGVTLA